MICNFSNTRRRGCGRRWCRNDDAGDGGILHPSLLSGRQRPVLSPHSGAQRNLLPAELLSQKLLNFKNKCQKCIFFAEIINQSNYALESVNVHTIYCINQTKPRRGGCGRSRSNDADARDGGVLFHSVLPGGQRPVLPPQFWAQWRFLPLTVLNN